MALVATQTKALVCCCTNFIMLILTSLVIYYEQIGSYGVTDGSLADHSGTVVITDSGPRSRSLKVHVEFHKEQMREIVMRP